MKEEKRLSELSKPELKVLIAQFNLSEKCIPSKLSKKELIKFVDEKFLLLFPNHPRVDNELLDTIAESHPQIKKKI